MSPQQMNRYESHALPAWFIKFQDGVGLSLLVLALMGINGLVYASGTVKDVQRPDTWGLFGTVLFVLFFAAGAAMPGIALRAGAGIFAGSLLRRFACAAIALMFFVLEVWASVTERSLMTFTTPADRWLLSIIHMPNLPFSPTVFALSLAISIAVIAWGIVVTPPARESEEDAAHKERLKTLRAQAKAERRRIFAESLGSATHAALQAAKQDETPAIDATNTPALNDSIPPHESGTDGDDMPPNGGGNTPGNRRTSRRNNPGLKAVPSGMWKRDDLQRYAQVKHGVSVSDDEATRAVSTLGNHRKYGRSYIAPKAAVKAWVDRTYGAGNAETIAGERGA